jgi:hypothetical protein
LRKEGQQRQKIVNKGKLSSGTLAQKMNSSQVFLFLTIALIAVHFVANVEGKCFLWALWEWFLRSKGWKNFV